jgi:hypothetical protein
MGRTHGHQLKAMSSCETAHGPRRLHFVQMHHHQATLTDMFCVPSIAVYSTPGFFLSRSFSPTLRSARLIFSIMNMWFHYAVTNIINDIMCSQ